MQWLCQRPCCGIADHVHKQHLYKRALIPELFAAAALSGSCELLRWLASVGCPMDGTGWVTAATYGGAAQLQLLQQLGCPMPVRGLTVPPVRRRTCCMSHSYSSQVSSTACR